MLFDCVKPMRLGAQMLTLTSGSVQLSEREEVLDLQKDEKNKAGGFRYDLHPTKGDSTGMLKTYLHNIGDLEFQNEWGKLW
jgi:hypothetical protein